MTQRRKAREMAVQMLYQSDLGGASWREVVSSFDPIEVFAVNREEVGERPGGLQPPRPAVARGEGVTVLEEAFTYARRLVQGALDHREEIDGLIRQQAENWRLERMPAVDRNILRLAVYELLFEAEVPKLVVVDEAIELAKKYGSERSSQFINGLLDGLIKSLPLPGTLR